MCFLCSDPDARLLCSQCYTHLRPVGPPDGLGDPVAGGGQRVEVDAALDAQAVEQVHHVLACHVAGGPLGIGAAAEAGDGAVDYRHAFLEHSIEVGQRLAVGIVEVGGELVHGDVARHRLDHALGLSGVPVPMVSPSETS